MVDAVLKQLKSGTYKEAAELVSIVEANGGTFSRNQCSALSVYQKIRAFVLWVQGSDDHRAK